MPLPTMSPYIGMVMRRRIEGDLDHIYTRIPRVNVADNPATVSDESQDAWGEQVVSQGAAIPNLPCRLLTPPKTDLIQGPNGILEVWIPILVVPQSDPIFEGDWVSSVLGPADPATGVRVTMLATTVQVLSTAPTNAIPGGALCKEVRLQGVTLSVA